MNSSDSIKPTFKKSERLKSRSTILKLFSLNQSLSIYPFRIIWLVENSPDLLKIEAGVSVSKKKFKNAVDRNLIKRRMREAYRLNKHLVYVPLKSEKIKIAFMIIYTAQKHLPYKEYDKKIKQLLLRLSQSVEKMIEKYNII